MKYTELFFEAIEKNELQLLLRGEKHYKIETSQYVPSLEPTDVSRVLTAMVYKAYELDISIKEKVEDALWLMLEQTDYDVYIVISYVFSQLFKEKHALSPFVMDMSRILPKLQEEIAHRKDRLKRGIVFPKSAKYPEGFVHSTAWADIESLNGICIREYGVKLFF